MGKVNQNPDLGNVTSLEELKRWVSVFLGNIKEQFNGQIEFDLNTYTSTIDVTFTAANTEVRAFHKLGRVPRGYIDGGNKTAALVVYNGDTANTNELIFLKSSAVGSCRVIVY